MDERVPYGCHNSALSTANSQTAPLRGSSQFIIDHPSFTHLLCSSQEERMRSMKRRSDKGCSWLLFLSVCLLSLEESSSVDFTRSQSLHGLSFLSSYHSWSSLWSFTPFSLFSSSYTLVCIFCLSEEKCIVMRWCEIRIFCHFGA